jgi:hypothetical protein
MAESRLSRWARLKQKGGADEREERSAAEDRARAADAKAAATETIKLPGGARVRNFVPAMPPLAPEAEAEDDRLSRGIGHVEEPATPADEESDNKSGDLEERELTDAEKAAVADLPAIDSLTAESDLGPFMREGVPAFIRRRALRAMWRLNPVFGFRDGLDDYDEDFNVIDKIIDSGTGNYRVGRGFLSDKELRDMTPENARRAFGEDIEEDEVEEADLAEDEENEDVDVGDVGEGGDDDPLS